MIHNWRPAGWPAGLRRDIARGAILWALVTGTAELPRMLYGDLGWVLGLSWAPMVIRHGTRAIFEWEQIIEGRAWAELPPEERQT